MDAGAAVTHLRDKSDDDSQQRMERMEKRMEEAENSIRKLQEMEEKVRWLEEEGGRMRDEVRLLRERVEECEFAKRRLEEKMLESGEEARKEWEAAIAVAGKKLSEEMKEQRRAPEANLAPPRRSDNGGGERRRSQGGGRGPEEEEGGRRRKKAVIFTDSNGREATEDSVKRHIPREERDDHQINISVAYTLEEAFHRVFRGEIDVRGATVVLDNLTNDVRGTQRRPAATPDEVVDRVDRLRKGLLSAGAETVVVAEIKPMQPVDVRPHNRHLHRYLCAQGQGGYGVCTQIRMNALRHDGFHINRQFDTVIDRTYACAIRGVPVPSPTPVEDFEPDHVRRRRHLEWPRIGDANAQTARATVGQALNRVHGWQW